MTRTRIVACVWPILYAAIGVSEIRREKALDEGSKRGSVVADLGSDHWPCHVAEVGMRISMAGDFVAGAMSGTYIVVIEYSPHMVIRLGQFQ